MTTSPRRAPRVAGGLLALGLTLVGGACGRAGSEPEVRASPGSSPSTPDRVFEAVVEDGTVVGGGAYRVEAATGERVQLVVTSDVADEVHIHGSDRRIGVAADATVELDFVARASGAFDVELERRGLRLLTIEVAPAPIAGRRQGARTAPSLAGVAAGALVVLLGAPGLRRRLLRPWPWRRERWVTTAFVQVHGVAVAARLRALTGAGEPPGRPGASKEGRPRLRYMPALDGLRALAVIAVLAYHADLRWARGGFLGVDVFFVISGYLITALLLADWRTHGRMDLLRFWRRRALRLLPALVVLLAAVSVAVPLAAPDQGSRLRGDLLAALTYVSNWRLVFEHQSYFEAVGRPPLLQHLWTLAVEEQFYLAWPVVLAGALAVRRHHRRLAWMVVTAAVASAALMEVLYRPDADPSRVYFGTDTRLATLLTGAALAFVWSPAGLTEKVRPGGRALLEGAGVAGLLGLAWFVIRANEFDEWLYRGGFLAVAALAAVVVAITAHPGASGFCAVVGCRPLAWLGARSYGIYLWHWPVFMLTRPHSDVAFDGYPLLAVRVALTVVLAAASYRWVECPVRSGALGRRWTDLRRATTSWSRPSPATAAGALGSLTALLALTTGVATPRAAPDNELVVDGVATATTVVATRPGAGPTSGPRSPVRPIPRGRVLAIGDSVLDQAKPFLEQRLAQVDVDAAVGRPVRDAVRIARTLRRRGRLGDEVIVHMGNNGVIRRRHVDELMQVLEHVDRVVVVNVKVPRPWEAENNEVLADAVRRWPNAELVDWFRAGSEHPEVFYDDGTHLRPDGIALYVDLVLDRL